MRLLKIFQKLIIFSIFGFISVNPVFAAYDLYYISIKDPKKNKVDETSPYLVFDSINLQPDINGNLISKILSNEKLNEFDTDKNVVLTIEKKFRNSYLYTLQIQPDSTKFSQEIKLKDLYGNESRQYVFYNLDGFSYSDNIYHDQCSVPEDLDLLTVQVDKFHCVDTKISNYLDLFTVNSRGRDFGILRQIKDPLFQMVGDAEIEGVDLILNSAYRDEAMQLEAKENFISEFGTNLVDQYVARPGYSEHILGTAVDFLSLEVEEKKVDKFEYSSVYYWLEQNAYKYGFVNSFRENSLNIAGYDFEPWHWRFVGFQHARNIHELEGELTLQEYLWIINNT